MSTSGTYNYNPSLGEITLYAFNLAGVRNTAITQEHMSSAKTAANMMLSRWSNQGVNLWQVDLVTTPLVQGQTTYSVDPSTVMILDAYLTTTTGSTQPIDRYILPISRTEYASYPNKQQQGFSTVYWFDRLLSPNITLWPVPDGSSAQSLSYYRVKQIQDSNFTNGQQVDIPYLWLEAFAFGLAERLSMIWNPQATVMLKAAADDAYNVVAAQNVENANTYISPQIIGYYRP